jgi:hypothetical protein
MVTDVVKRLRDVLAFALLGVAALYLLSALVLIFKSSQIGEPFSYRAGLYEYLFTVPILLLALVGAVLLAAAFSEPSRYARAVVLAALAIGGLALLFGLICWVTSLGSDNLRVGSGLGLAQVKFASLTLALAKLGLLALVLLFAYSLFSRLPRSVRAPQQPWGAPPGYGPQQQYPGGQPYAPYGQPGQGYAPPPAGQPGWAPQPEQQWGQPPEQGWPPPAPAQPAWGGPPEQQHWGSPPVQQEWAPPPGSGPQAWGQPTPDQPGWGDYPSAAEPPDHARATGATAADQLAPDALDPSTEPPDEAPEQRP